MQPTREFLLFAENDFYEPKVVSGFQNDDSSRREDFALADDLIVVILFAESAM